MHKLIVTAMVALCFVSAAYGKHGTNPNPSQHYFLTASAIAGVATIDGTASRDNATIIGNECNGGAFTYNTVQWQGVSLFTTRTTFSPVSGSCMAELLDTSGKVYATVNYNA